MSEMICITCPMGCHLSIERPSDDEIVVSGNRCPRGEKYAREELLSPKRVVTATCRALGSGEALASGEALGSAAAAADGALAGQSPYRPRRVPLRTNGAFPKERVPELLKLIYALELRLPVRRGQVAIADALGTGIDVLVARTM
jgi:CxxC motif-containing protein